MTSYYVDIHTHLTDERFQQDWQKILLECEVLGFRALVVNGLDPVSNRQILEMAKQYPIVKPALGIYPIDAVNDLLSEDFELKVRRFDVEAEIAFIEEQAQKGSVHAIGECGLDGYWLKDYTFKRQEEVFCRLLEIAKKYDLPAIIHTRKLEQRAMDILKEVGIQKVDFHCYGGKVKPAITAAESFGWWFSIPANARKSESFTKMLKSLPLEKILTETDAPYMGPIKGERNEPKNILDTVRYLAELRGLNEEEAKSQVWKNYLTLTSQN